MTDKVLTSAYSQILEYAKNSAFSKAEIQNLDGPERVAKGLTEMIWSKSQIVNEIDRALGTAFPVSNDGDGDGDDGYTPSSSLVVNPIYTRSLCPHHFLPILNTVSIAYTCKGLVLGLSKVPRVIDALSRRAVIQEQLGSDIVSTFVKGKCGNHVFRDSGVFSSCVVKIKAQHLCMVCRGVEQREASTSSWHEAGDSESVKYLRNLIREVSGNERN